MTLRLNGRSCVALLAAGLLALSAAGCGPKIKPKRSLDAPPIVYCHDGVGHIEGNAPWILGGKCCCTPTLDRFASYRSEGTVPEGMTYEQFLKMFKDRGIITDLDVDYRASNCRDAAYGPHVVFGGKCMVTPTPGTRTCEEVTSGIQHSMKQ